MTIGSADDSNFGAESMYGAQTKRGLVQVTLGRERVVVPPAKAREMAQFLIECAAAAETDEIMVKTLEKAGLSEGRIRLVIVAIRQERAILERRARREAREGLAHDQEAADLDNPDPT